MPVARHNRRFTIYDAMEARGDFEINPANATSRNEQGLSLYKGPVPFPKMLYHPEGKERVVRKADAVATPFGPQWVGEQRELISKIVEDDDALQEALADGWHLTPRAAREAAWKMAKPDEAFPEPASLAEKLAGEKDREIAELKRQLAEMTARQTESELGLAKGKGK